ncbi:MAG: hypothetical protein A2W22_05280 [Candidatus Levybacteria bacterium RBG_16_35_11]|nr:MAG: hypothetical protein A2W22_05280 [Candidatus Levybacteria bacterium RBG_16_35_11]
MKKILEIGCGQGFRTYLLSKQKNNKVIGIDASKKDIEICKKRYPRIEFLNMNAEKLLFKDKSFDQVLAIDILEHVDNLRKTIAEITRVLKSKGKVIVNVPHYKSEEWLLKIRPTYFSEIHHVRFFKEGEIESLFKESKMVLEKKKKKGFLQHFELYFLFKRKVKSDSQLSIGSWRDNFYTKAVHAFFLMFDPVVVRTPLVYFPLWIITVPIGFVFNWFGNLFLPKSFYYEFVKN